VNDREGQLQGYHLDISALSDEEWALENLAGCDGQLFKVIAKLGRLNVLSQGNPVEEIATVVSRPPAQTPFAVNLDYRKFDGNGWMRLVDDENLFSSKSAVPDTKAQFWREWREVRQALMTWQLDTTVFDSSSTEAPYLTYDQRIDLSNISESFRYSALLYTERLANSSVPSTDSVIRNWVQECLKYIKEVKSDVYLLWPLFITGSECVDNEDREVIRRRCLDIQKDSGFLNNKSCLELLEKVWRSYDEKRTTSTPTAGSTSSDIVQNQEAGFRFSTIMRMENNEGEYIVV
jgi:Fungal specific transcription factor domain